MKSIIRSLLVVVAVAAATAGTTYALVSRQSTANNKDNNFSSGTLDISMDGNACIHHHKGDWDNDHRSRFDRDWDECNGHAIFNVKNAQPGTCKTESLKVKNTGSLVARDLTVDWGNKHGKLCEALEVKIGDLILPQPITGTIDKGSTQDIPVTVCFTNTNGNQNKYQGKKCEFDLSVSAKAYE